MQEKKKTNLEGFFEFRVILIILCVTLASAVSFYYIIFTQFHDVIIGDLKADANSIYNYIDTIVDESSFCDLNTIEDEQKENYERIRRQLDQVRKITNTRYLYTAKQNEMGDFIYVIDGMNKDAEDFRHIGTAIEEEFIQELDQCFQDRIILGNGILETEWGDLYTSYFPVHGQDGSVIGAVVIVFDVERLYLSYSKIPFYTIMTAIGIIVIFSLAAILVFKKVSEPLYKKMANVDVMTGLNNRTAFELEMKNIEKKLNHDSLFSIVVYDLNYLKLVNDKLGHSAGDTYIKNSANFILKTFQDIGTCYRIGGDEFAVLVIGKTEYEIKERLENSYKESTALLEGKENLLGDLSFGVAYGYGQFDPEIDKGPFDTFNRADDRMYTLKRRMKDRSLGQS